MDQQFPSNSKPIGNRTGNRAATSEEPKNIVPVVRGQATRRKASIGKRMTRNVLGDDVQSVWGYVFGDVLIPAARDMIADGASVFIERMIFGDSGSGRPRRGRSSGGHTSYNTISSSRGRDRYRDESPRGREVSRRGRSNHNFDEIILDERVEAEEVLDRMDAMIDKYDHVSVAEFYELCAVSSEYTDRKYGWTDIGSASITRNRGGGYIINLPRPEPLD